MASSMVGGLNIVMYIPLLIFGALQTADLQPLLTQQAPYSMIANFGFIASKLNDVRANR